MLNTATAQVPTSYTSEETTLVSKRDPNRNLTRYVFCIADHIAPQDKVMLDSIGGYLGGVYVGAS